MPYFMGMKLSGKRLTQEQYEKKMQNLDREIEHRSNRLMDEIEKLLEIYLTEMLALTHRRLVKSIIELPQYYKDTQMLQNCIERFNKVREL